MKPCTRVLLILHMINRARRSRSEQPNFRSSSLGAWSCMGGRRRPGELGHPEASVSDLPMRLRVHASIENPNFGYDYARSNTHENRASRVP